MSESTISPAEPVPAEAAANRLPAGLVAALRRPRFEVLPLAGTLEQVEQHVPRDCPVTVTASPRLGLEPTLALTEALSQRGFEAVPHLAARLVVDEAHLRETLHRLHAVGVNDAFVISGDGQQPLGKFPDSLALLSAMRRLGDSELAPVPARLGIAGYPEGHPLVAAAELDAALCEKQAMASYAVTQLCFDAGTISTWVSRVRDLGVQLPLQVGVAGAVDQRKLLRIVGRIGVGSSARFLRKHRYGMVRLLRPGGYRPDRLLRGLADDLTEPARGVAGLHLYTFGDVAATERWRRRALERLTGEDGHA